MRICRESRALLRTGLLMSALLYLFAAVLPYIASDLPAAMECARISRSARETAPGMFLVCLIGAIAFDLGTRERRAGR